MAGGILYLIGVGLYSVIPQIFYAETATIPDDLTCSQGIEDLRTELLDRAGTRISSGGESDPAPLRAWLRDWDGRHRALEPRCENSDIERWTLLGRLRRRLQGTLERYDREEGELARATNRASST